MGAISGSLQAKSSSSVGVGVRCLLLGVVRVLRSGAISACFRPNRHCRVRCPPCLCGAGSFEMGAILSLMKPNPHHQ
ncbi:hypothetical protein AVEN_254586-1 [Araneus ventricosus]|uniref:Uncharacterized protein n=1 Tax=Araneus ventricosus TaxID=182803 RepID=A0A4Y2GEN4_ARAVE|nr:hypothetical protein AVEN_254586-1 [Araneus ventricosus]